MRIRRDYFHHPQGELHYRYLCPSYSTREHSLAVVLIHQSPQHGGALEGAMRELAKHFAVYVPDLPGYGNSDAIDEPSIPAFADRIGDFMAAIVREPAVIFGQHTGALVAAEVAVRSPAQVSAFVADGYPLFNATENADLLANYFPDLTPRADGGHLLTLWQRLQKQYRQYPWYAEAGSAHSPWLELKAQEPSADRLHQLLRETLHGEAPWRGYRAVFEFSDAENLLRKLSVPTRLVYREEDVLAYHMPRVPNSLPAVVEVERAQGHAAWISAIEQFA